MNTSTTQSRKGSKMKNYKDSFIAVLNDPETRAMVDAIEDTQSSLRSYPNGEKELERVLAAQIKELKDTCGYDWNA